MQLPITMSLAGTDQRVMDMLARRLPAGIKALQKEMDVQDVKLQRYIQTQKLSGQVLQHRSGMLFGSIRILPAKIQGNAVTGGVFGGGERAPYGIIQELGSTNWYDIYPVNAKALAWQGPKGMIFAKHVHHPPIKQRSFMKSSVDDKRDEITAALRTAFAKGVAGVDQ